MENSPPPPPFSDRDGLDEVEKAQIVRAFFDLADAVMEEVRHDISQDPPTSASRRKIGQLIDKHSDAKSANHIKNIWKALQYLVEASLPDKGQSEPKSAKRPDKSGP